MRLLFSSIHCCLDPSSGAALCTRQLLELLAARGADCRVLTTGILDRETSLDEVLATLELPVRRFQAELRSGGAAEVIDLSVNGVRVTLMPTVSSRAERSPDPRESAIFLELAEQAFDRFRPDVLLTYGGHPASLELMRRARLRGIAVVFHLLNFGQSEPKGSDSKNDRRAFADVSAVIFPSEYSRRHHARLLGLGGSGHPRPNPARSHRRRGPRVEIRHVHQPPAVYHHSSGFGSPDFPSESAATGLTSLKRKRRAFENTYNSMPFACASGLLQATFPASFAFSTAIDLAL